MNMTIANQVLDEIGAMPLDMQRHVLEFARALAASTHRDK
jgi:DNA-binding NtrC family response regulator